MTPAHLDSVFDRETIVRAKCQKDAREDRTESDFATAAKMWATRPEILGDIQSGNRQLLDRRVDVPLLQRQLSLLSTSSQVRASTVEALHSRASLIKLQQMSRAAVEAANGKLLSSVKSTTGQQRDAVILLISVHIGTRRLPTE
ncbi:hypothetical protein [Bradyrhizobium sp.]|uniref:hypothetical protein n=1 Tax=Bradyrhizobium sp. TaxID=376 RepID=UPI0025C49104|nr:hypothetical protein [Bradyrhizobium sp.]